jgi:hypothetical protein
MAGSLIAGEPYTTFARAEVTFKARIETVGAIVARAVGAYLRGVRAGAC